MNRTSLGYLALILSLLLAMACSCRRTNEAPPVGQVNAGEAGEDASGEKATDLPPRPPEPEQERAGYDPSSTGDRIVVEPEEPAEGEAFQVRAGPLTFRNGCEGIERSWAEGPDEDGRILLHWEPRAVPPDAMCTMALHSQWIEVSMDGLPAGEYLLVAEGVGEKELIIAPAGD